jgi:hypothetical protein
VTTNLIDDAGGLSASSRLIHCCSRVIRVQA